MQAMLAAPLDAIRKRRASAALTRRKPDQVPGHHPPRDRSPQPRRPSPGTPLLAGLTILVVEDHEDTRLLLSHLLGAAGASVKLARNGYEGLDRVAQAPLPDLILCDLLMPALDGLAFARRLHADPRWAHIPIIAVTALGEAGDYIRTRAHGFQGHLVKPVDGDQLVDSIRRVRSVGRRRRPGSTR